MNSGDTIAICVLKEEKNIIMYRCDDKPSKEDETILKWINKRIQGIENSYLDL